VPFIYRFDYSRSELYQTILVTLLGYAITLSPPGIYDP